MVPVPGSLSDPRKRPAKSETDSQIQVLGPQIWGRIPASFSEPKAAPCPWRSNHGLAHGSRLAARAELPLGKPRPIKLSAAPSRQRARSSFPRERTTQGGCGPQRQVTRDRAQFDRLLNTQPTETKEGRQPPARRLGKPLGNANARQDRKWSGFGRRRRPAQTKQARSA